MKPCAHAIELDDCNPKAVFVWCSCNDWRSGPHGDAGEAKAAHRGHINDRKPRCSSCSRRHHGTNCPEGI